MPPDCEMSVISLLPWRHTVIKITSPRQMATFLCNSIWTLGSVQVRNSLIHVYTFSLSTICSGSEIKMIYGRACICVFISVWLFLYTGHLAHIARRFSTHCCGHSLSIRLPETDNYRKQQQDFHSKELLPNLTLDITPLSHVRPPEAVALT